MTSAAASEDGPDPRSPGWVPGGKQSASVSAGERILVVEDEFLVGEDLKSRLEDMGYGVVGPVATAEEALGIVAGRKPDLVLMDIVLAGPMDGIDGADRIRKGYDVPVLFLTAYSDPTTIERAKAVHPYGYIVKPVRDRDLYVNVAIALYRARTEKRLREAERALSVGRLAGGIAHNLNNLMTVVVGYCSILREETGPRTRGRDIVDNILAAGDRAAYLTRQLLSYSRQQMLCPQKSDANALLAGMEEELKIVAGKDIRFAIRTAKELLPVSLDPRGLRDALEHLVANGRDAIEGDGAVTISLGERRFEKSENIDGVPIEAGDYVVIAVSDTGCGMDEAMRSGIFAPFTSSKAFGRGLGLPSVYGFVKQSGGYILVDSAVGTGTTVTIYLPRASG